MTLGLCSRQLDGNALSSGQCRHKLDRYVCTVDQHIAVHATNPPLMMLLLTRNGRRTADWNPQQFHDGAKGPPPYAMYITLHGY